MQDIRIEWRLNVPAVETLSPSFKDGFSDLERKCSNAGKLTGRFPDTFTHMSFRTSSPSLVSSDKELTPGNLGALWQDQAEGPSLEIIFLTSRGLEDSPRERALSVKWMAENLGVSPSFFDGVFHVTESTVLELPPLPTRDLPEEETPLDDNLNGVYITSLNDLWTTVWFSHQLDGMVSLYIIHDAGGTVMLNIAKCVGEGGPLPFLGIDTLILSDEKIFHEDYHKAYDDALESLSRMNSPEAMRELRGPSSVKPSREGKSAIVLQYTAVYNILRAYRNKRSIVELLKRLVATRKRLLKGRDDERFKKYRDYFEGSWKMELAQTTELLDSIQGTLDDREDTIKSSVALLRTLMNVRIAMYSADMARESKKDSSSMTTVSLLTMLFLPGTFLASFFSTSLVKLPGASEPASDSAISTTTTTVTDDVKLVAGASVFSIVTVCLTVFVFAVWIFYHGRHYYSIPHQLKRLPRRREKPCAESPV